MIDRATPRLALALTAAVLACAGKGAGTGPFRASDPAQAIESAANEAQAEVGGVAVRAALAGWHGKPRHLEQRLTPVDVTVRNRSGKPIRLGPEAFHLVVGDVRLRVLDRSEVTRALSDLADPDRPRGPRTGAVGGPTFPGYDTPNPYGPGSDSPPSAPVPALGSWYGSQLVSATLANGASTSVMLYFDMPARTLRNAAFEVEVVGEDGERIGTIRLPYERDPERG